MKFKRNRVLCHAALPQTIHFADIVDTAAARGFDEISIWISHLRPLCKEFGSSRALYEFLTQRKMRISILEIWTAWYEAPGNAAYADNIDDVMQLAADFRADIITSACLDPEIPQRRQAYDSLREQCQLFAQQGLKIAFEFLPWSAVPDLKAAQNLCGEVGVENLGYLFDTWHFIRSGMDWETLEKIPGESLFHIQINDAPASAEEDILDETMHKRLFPGEGCLDWPRMHKILADKCPDVPITAEIFNDSLQKMPLQEAVDKLYLAVTNRFCTDLKTEE